MCVCECVCFEEGDRECVRVPLCPVCIADSVLDRVILFAR